MNSPVPLSVAKAIQKLGRIKAGKMEVDGKPVVVKSIGWIQYLLVGRTSAKSRC